MLRIVDSLHDDIAQEMQWLSAALDKVGLSWRISDHYPLWVEFKVR